MAFSIESRVPFLDYRLVDFCFKLPYYKKIHNGTTKALLRKALKGILPEKIRCRRDKLGFPAPLPEWIKKELSQPIREIIFSEKANQRGIFNMESVSKRFESHVMGKADHTWEIWRWLSMEIWFHEFIDNEIKPA